MLPGLIWLLKGMYRLVLASTCEHGGHRHVWSGGVAPRSYRRDDRHGRRATARVRPVPSHLHAPSVSALWAPGLSSQTVPADLARLGQSRRGGAAGSRGHLGAALLYEVSQVLEGGPLGSRPPQEAGHPPHDGRGGAAGGRGWLARPASQLTLLARPSCLWPVCDAPERGRSWGKKAQGRRDTASLDWAWADCAGYGAAAARYAGPFWMLSAVDKRRYKRLLDDVLEHDPTHDAIRAFLGRLPRAWAARHRPLCGGTTDGAALYPVPRSEGGGEVPHPICTLHVLAEVGNAVLGAVASARQGLAATQPTLRRGRPSTPAAKQAVRTTKRLAAPGAALCAARHLFVPRHLSTTARKTLWRVSRG